MYHNQQENYPKHFTKGKQLLDYLQVQKYLSTYSVIRSLLCLSTKLTINQKGFYNIKKMCISGNIRERIQINKPVRILTKYYSEFVAYHLSIRKHKTELLCKFGMVLMTQLW